MPIGLVISAHHTLLCRTQVVIHFAVIHRVVNHFARQVIQRAVIHSVRVIEKNVIIPFQASVNVSVPKYARIFHRLPNFVPEGAFSCLLVLGRRIMDWYPWTSRFKVVF